MNVLARRPVQIVVGVIVALALFGGGYALGSTRTPAPAATNGATGATGARGNFGGAGGANGGAGARGAGGGVTTGQILSVNTDSITVSVRAGGANGATGTTTTELVLVGSGTRVVKAVESDVKLSDLKVGDQITVAGTPDTASGTISAQTIVVGATNILGDILGGAGFPGVRGAGASGSPRPSPTR
ncbi:MAG TPA: hypothetical protein VL333_02615 [Candidatus Saccharimonadales bacterium]|nr:hypothetical protein [Candidatus Saccharimonadales bacterium]